MGDSPMNSQEQSLPFGIGFNAVVGRNREPGVAIIINVGPASFTVVVPAHDSQAVTMLANGLRDGLTTAGRDARRQAGGLVVPEVGSLVVPGGPGSGHVVPG